jgi:Zn-dependent protease with chaperone function
VIYETPELPEHVNAPTTHPLREFAGILIAVVAVIGTLCAVVWWSASWLARQTPFEWETELVGETILGPFEAERESERTQALRELGVRLSSVMALPDDMPINIHYSNSEVPNAFATLGGHIVITRGLIELVDSENALAMVLAHEIAHVEHRDPIGSLGGGLALGLMIAAVTGGGTDVTSIGASLTQLSFSRAQETAADEAAQDALRALYGHSGGAEQFFQRVQEIDPISGAIPSFLSTHPHAEDRLQQILRRQTLEPDERAQTPLPAVLRPLPAEDSAGH